MAAVERGELDGTAAADAGTVDEGVDAACRGDHFGDTGCDAGIIGDIDADDVEAEFSGGGGEIRCRFRRAGSGKDAPAACGEVARGGQADAGAAAGDENGAHASAFVRG